METEKWKSAAARLFSKDKGVRILVLMGFCGIALIYLSSLGGGEKDDPQPTDDAPALTAGAYREELEAGVARIVTAITGEEDPQVLVTLESGERYVYAADEHSSTQEDRGEKETAHVILEDAGGAQSALTVTRIEPQIKGVVIVSRYAGDPATREMLTEAARTALGLPSTKVCVTGGG